MQVQHLSSSTAKAITTFDQGASTGLPARRLMIIGIVGTAVFDYQIHKTAALRIRLERLTAMAHSLGDLTESDAAIVAALLAKPTTFGANV